MKRKKPYGYWKIKENCHKEALNYDNISEFAKNHGQAYLNVNKMNWGGDIFSHMIRKGNSHNRCIYSFEFSDNHAYIGLTYDINERKSGHLNTKTKKQSSVAKHIIKTGLIPKFFKLTEYIFIAEAILQEEKFLNDYVNNGWKILNQMKTGGIGGNILYWTKEKCQEEALIYEFRNEFRINANGAYDAAYRNGWLDLICSHMLIHRKNKNYWTFNKCLNEYLKYENKTKFARKSSGAYDAAHRNGWLKKIYEN